MLENIRERSQGTGAKIILGLVILTFAFAGIGSYTNSVDTSVAEVNDVKISQQDFDKAFQQQRAGMVQQYGEMFESLLANPQYLNGLRSDVLNRLINEKLLDQNTDALSIRISDELIKKTIIETPQFQVDGKFDNDRYLALISQAGFFDASYYRDYLRVTLARQQLTQSIMESEFGLPYEAKMLSSLRDQKRDLRFATVSVEQFKAQVSVSEDEIADHYQANQSSYMSDEQAKVDYILLDVNDVAKTINISDDDAKAYYDNNIAAYTTEEKRRVSHILFDAADKAKAEEVLAKVNAGDDFAELAKTHSVDTVSAENGGDLEWLEAGVMVPVFEDAAMALAATGDTSGLVESEFGLHIIKLTELQPEVVTAFADAKTDVIAKAAKDAAENKFFELKDELGRLAFELPDSLEEAAESISAKVQTSTWLKRNGNVAPFNNPSVIDAVFSDLVISENLNSEIIEVSDEIAVVVHINEYQAAEVKPLADVSESIKASLIAEKADQKAQDTVDELLAKFTAGKAIDEALTAVGSKFEVKADIARFGSDVDNAIITQAFKLPHPEEGSVSAAKVALSGGDVALVEVQAVKEGEAKELGEQFNQQFASQVARSAFASYVSSLSDDAKITKRISQAAE